MNEGTQHQNTQQHPQNSSTTISNESQELVLAFTKLMAPPELQNTFFQILGHLSLIQQRSISEINSLTETSSLESKMKDPDWDWKVFNLRACSILKRSVALMKKILNLRAKASMCLYMSERKNPGKTIEQYELAKRDLIEVKSHMREKLFMTKYSVSELQTNKEQTAKKKLDISLFELRQILSSLQVLSQQCSQSLLELEMIEELYGYKPQK